MKNATEQDKEWQQAAHRDANGFWAAEAQRLLTWQRPFTQASDWSFAKDNLHIRWFADGALNVAANCVDRHAAVTPNKTALIIVPDDPARSTQHITYQQLYQQVCQTANLLLSLGVQAGDRVTIYLPMIPQAAIAMLACARIGAVHSVVFGGFSAHALRERIEDCGSEIIITADGGQRGGKAVALKANVDEACTGLPVRHVLVWRHTDGAINWQEERDIDWRIAAELQPATHEAEAFDAEHPLFVLYTSGSTGKPKGVQHSSAGYLLYALHTFLHAFDYREDDIFWCTADVGWITGHSYMVYGPLAAGATSLLFEGVPTWPDASRLWQIVDAERISLFYTAPTALRMLMREGDDYLAGTKRDSLRVLGSVGEPINPEAWHWYHNKVGRGHCAVVDTWWQTETGGHMLLPLPQRIAQPKPGAAMQPYYGIQPVLLSAQGQVIDGEGEGALCFATSWPGQARSIWGDHPRFVETYFSAYPGYYFSGDAATRDADGDLWIKGRMDDVVNVAGHRMGTAEIEAVINAHPAVAESAVVGVAHSLKGQGIYAFVILHKGIKIDEAQLTQEVNQQLRAEIGPIAKADVIQLSEGLPKTRSGKIMRRILRKIAGGEVTGQADYHLLGDISTLLNPELIDSLVAGRHEMPTT